jgi:hypothetical protein
LVSGGENGYTNGDGSRSLPLPQTIVTG